jgi:hypothetical protein
MIRQDGNPHRPSMSSAAAGGLFARKGEATPVGGWTAPRRLIAMRPLVSERSAAITVPMPANTSAPGPVAPRRKKARRRTASNNGVSTVVPTMGPAAGAAAIHAGLALKGMAIRGPVRSRTEASPRRAAKKRTTLCLDDALHARIARFSASETLSIQSLVTRALLRFLPAISVERSAAASLRLPADMRIAARHGRRSVRFDPHLYWRLKTAADNRRRSMQSIMIAALEAYLGELEADARGAAGTDRLSVVA